MASTDTQVREFVITLKMGKQIIEFNIENTEEEHKKGFKKNEALFLLNSSEVEVFIEERFYRIEKDYSAMTSFKGSLVGKSYASLVKEKKI